MRFRVLSAVGMLAMSANVAQAQAGNGGATQDPQCVAGNILTRDACQQTVDLFNYVAPLLGTALAGGNTTMAQGGSMGTRLGFMPHVSVGVRINAVLGNVPEVQTPSATGIVNRTNSPSPTAPIPMPVVDAAIGVFKGVP